mgnify:CR=1 FL=1
MPTVTLDFDNPINASCQVGDIAYFVNTSSSEKAGHENSGFTINSDAVQELGSIRAITTQSGSSTFLDRIIVYTTTAAGWSGTQSRFIFFSKDNKANLSSPLGYFASIKISNNSTEAAELHAINLDYFESSK